MQYVIFSFNEQFANTNLKLGSYLSTFHRWNIILICFTNPNTAWFIFQEYLIWQRARGGLDFEIFQVVQTQRTNFHQQKKCCQVKLLFKSTFHSHLNSTKFWSVTTSTFTLQFQTSARLINLLKLLQFMFNTYTTPQNWNFHLLSCFKRISLKTYHLKHF